MKTKTTFFRKAVLPSIIAVVFAMLLAAPAFPQEYVKPRPDLVPAPSREKFAAMDAAASPWWAGTCPDKFYKIIDCERLRSPYDDRYFIKELPIYNPDASVWLRVSRSHGAVNYYERNEGKYNFLPFGSWARNGSSILRMVAESEHWYEVEVNVRTHATKYILKSDSLWEKKSWDFWLAKMAYFIPEQNITTTIYDKPDGEIIAASSDSKMTHLRYLGTRDGDWAFVQVSVNGQFCYPVVEKSEQCYPGWVRWKDGWDFLVNTNPIFFRPIRIRPDVKEGYADRAGVKTN